ncbi:MAG: DUF814 domain-containing protein [Cryobacterium sp.]|nr:DUF814 domain-containing protein [Oligoflexia bacterium]
MQKPLNWREIALLAKWIEPEIVGMFVDRVVVPDRPEFPNGYLKNEWSLRLTSRGKEAALLLSVRPRRPSVDLLSGKGPRASPHATRSGFDLGLNKILSGRKVLGFQAVPRERSAILWVESDGRNAFGLVLTLIPALPEALLIEGPREGQDFKVLARSRGVPDALYRFPDGAKSPPELTVRGEGFEDLDHYRRAGREALDLEAFETRLGLVRSRITQDLKQAKVRLAQNQRTLLEAEREGEYRHQGDLLKSVMGLNPSLSSENKRRVLDWETGEETLLLCDPKLSLKEQVEKFYSLAKRKDRRISEARLRLTTFEEKVSRLETFRSATDSIAISALRGKAKLSELAPFEEKLGIAVGAPERPEAKATHGWSGKSFVAKEGLPILVGRSKDENLELTFKFARGNDLWLHVKGKPGSHVVIPLRSKKNASLETLLDAALLCIHYSNGANWGKTEVDYTHKKYVKRIRDSSEASYVNNKTLMIEPNPARLRELLGQDII